MAAPPATPAIGELHGHSGVARLVLFYVLTLPASRPHPRPLCDQLIYFNSRLLAMSEDDLPYQIRITPSGDLQTVDRYDFDGQLQSVPLSYDVVRKPYLKYFWSSPGGKKTPDIEIPIEQPTMVDDFAITENFVVIPDRQVVFKLERCSEAGLRWSSTGRSLGSASS
ncbi:unnamed protein product [Spirodela intermedia]|uniref:9-cis-epoxycarotenoid dioxygenase n=1 Tax=Spirodela intermedia TaxID=51605 RepID=A0ABN7EBX2_SPIIN|nr:unnamed protein product [Spirodela intermedia]